LGITKTEETVSAQEEENKQNSSHNYDLNPFKGLITSFLSVKSDLSKGNRKKIFDFVFAIYNKVKG